MKSASSVAQKFVERAGNAAADYGKGASETQKDQAALAIAAVPRMKTAINKAIDSGRVASGLQRSGKAGWLRGVTIKGVERFGPGVAASMAAYATNSGAYDAARGAAGSLPRGDKGSAQNLSRVAAVVNALRAKKVGSAG